MRHTLLQLAAAMERALRPSVHRAPPVSRSRNFLVLQHSLALGTAVHGTPLIRALHDAVPGCRIAVAGSGFGYDTHRHHPLLERVIRTPNPMLDLRGAIASLRGQLPFAGEPCVVLTPNGNQRTLVALQAMFAAAGLRVGFTEAPELYRVAVSYDADLSQIENNLRLVPALGHSLQNSRYEPEVFFTADDLAAATSLLQRHGIALERPLVVFVTQTSPTQRKSWRQERFRRVAEWMHARWQAQILFVGTTAESTAIDTLRSEMGFPTANLAGETTLAQLCAVLSVCDAGLTLDTGTLHLGRAVGLPMAILAPAWSPVREWLPIDDPRFVVLKRLTLAQQTDDYVIDEVSVADVQDAMEALLSRFPLLTRQGRRGLREAKSPVSAAPAPRAQ